MVLLLQCVAALSALLSEFRCRFRLVALPVSARLKYSFLA